MYVQFLAKDIINLQCTKPNYIEKKKFFKVVIISASESIKMFQICFHFSNVTVYDTSIITAQKCLYSFTYCVCLTNCSTETILLMIDGCGI